MLLALRRHNNHPTPWAAGWLARVMVVGLPVVLSTYKEKVKQHRRHFFIWPQPLSIQAKLARPLSLPICTTRSNYQRIAIDAMETLEQCI